MSLVFSAVVPHPPLLIEAIGKDKLAKLEQTKQALSQLEQDLYLAKPQIIVVITPHGSVFEDAFSINANTDYTSNFAAFGDLETKDAWKGTPDFAARISHTAKEQNVPTQLISETALDHGVSIPLHLLANHLPDAKILPVGFSHLSTEMHNAFGEILKDAIMTSDKRIALIASADLAHTLSQDAPAGFHADGEQFDGQVRALLSTKNATGYAGLPEALITNAASCGYRSILLLLAIMKDMNYEFKELSYEAPFGVGYLTGELSF